MTYSPLNELLKLRIPDDFPWKTEYLGVPRFPDTEDIQRDVKVRLREDELERATWLEQKALIEKIYRGYSRTVENIVPPEPEMPPTEWDIL